MRTARIAMGMLMLVPAALASGEPRPDKLPHRKRELISDRLVPAYRQGDTAKVLATLSPLFNSLGETQLATLDAALREHGLPGAVEIIADARLDSIARATELPAATEREANLVLEKASSSIAAALSGRATQRLLQPDRDSPATFKDFDSLIWDAHVYKNELEHAANVAIAAASLQVQRQSGQVPANTAAGEIVDFRDVLAKTYRERLELHERNIELKIERSRFALDKMLARRSSPIERISAAYSLQKDLPTLREIFTRSRGSDPKPFKVVNSLNSSKTRREVLQLSKSSRKYGGDLMARSEHLFDGLHWWFRGRYGRGTVNGGLLKPRNATTNARSLLSLNMPKATPQPTDPAYFASTGTSSPGEERPTMRVPDYDRRHHYIWSQEPPMFATQNVGLYFL